SLKHSLYAPVVTTLPATAISSNVATLNATVSPSNSPTSFYFEWGTTIGYGNFTSTQSVSSSVLYANLNQPLTGLTSGTTYHFRGVATNAGGIVFGADQAFRTVGTYIVTNFADN